MITMTLQEKTILFNFINNNYLTEDQKNNIAFIAKNQYLQSNTKDTWKFNIDRLSEKEMRELDIYIKKCIKENYGTLDLN